MRRFNSWLGLVALALAPAAWAVPDAEGNLVSPDAPDLSGDKAMSARLNYNVGFERFENARKLEMSGGSDAAVRQAFGEARDKFRAASADAPEMKEAWNMLGYTSRRLGAYEESLAAYDKALQLNPDYPEAIEYRAELFLLTGRLEDAKSAYQVLLKSSPDYAGVLKQAMKDWVKQKNAAPAVSAADRAAFASWVAKL